jgi:hypothetical protein
VVLKVSAALVVVLLLVVLVLLSTAIAELWLQCRALALLMSNLSTSIARPVGAATLCTASVSLSVLSAMTSSISSAAAKVTSSASMATSVILAAAKVASTSEATSSAETATAIAPGAPTTHHATANMAPIFERRALSNNLLEMVWSRKWLVHAEVLVLIVAVLEAATLVLHRLVVIWYVNVSFWSSRYRLLNLRFVVILPSSLLRLLLALVLGLLLVVGELDIIGLLVVEVGCIRVLLCAKWFGEYKSRVVFDVVDGCVFADA